MDNENVEVSPDQVPPARPFELALVLAVERLVVAVERIEQLLARRPVLSRRQAELVDLLGEAAQVVVLPPRPDHVPAPAPPHAPAPTPPHTPAPAPAPVPHPSSHYSSEPHSASPESPHPHSHGPNPYVRR